MKPVSVGTFRATPAMREGLNRVLDSGRISYGPLSLEFEQKFSGLHGCQYGILSNSGTSSLQVALQAMIEAHHWEGGQVIVPATTFVATANIVRHNRMVPVFVDVDPQTYNLDPEKLAEAITPDTRCIIPVHLFGQPADMVAIREVINAATHRVPGIKIIEDSCETMFALHHSKPVGAWGDIACFSLYVAHLLVAGVGGIATTNNPDYAARMRSLVNHGLELSCLNPGANFSPQPMPGRSFRFSSVGHSFRITEMEAALALAQLEDWPEMITQRRLIASALSTGFRSLNALHGKWFQVPYIAPENSHAFMMYPLVLRQGDREALLAYLNENQIETRDMLPLLNQPAYRHLEMARYPVSANLIKNGFYIGCHQDLSLEDVAYVLEIFGQWIRSQA